MCACVRNVFQKDEWESERIIEWVRERERERERDGYRVREKMKAKIVHVLMHMPI